MFQRHFSRSLFNQFSHTHTHTQAPSSSSNWKDAVGAWVDFVCRQKLLTQCKPDNCQQSCESHKLSSSFLSLWQILFIFCFYFTMPHFPIHCQWPDTFYSSAWWRMLESDSYYYNVTFISSIFIKCHQKLQLHVE